MKKKVVTIIIASILFITSFNYTGLFKAEETEQLKGIVKVDNYYALTDHSETAEVVMIDQEKYQFKLNQEVTIIDSYRDSNLNLWYNVLFKENDTDYSGWISYNYLTVLDNYQETLEKQGFSKDYIDKIMPLHEKYPNWVFTAMKTNIEWDTFISEESRKGVSLIDGTNLCYRSVEPYSYDVNTEKWIPLDGNNWFQANPQTVSYYADPRNFINEYRVFMFLSLNFHEIETASTIQQVVKNTFMDGTDPVDKIAYSQIFYDAGLKTGVSPIYLAVLALQEQGRSGTTCTSGQPFVYNDVQYSGLYNFYNIGATSGADNWKKGLVYANGGVNGTSLSYSRPWTSPKKAIEGGAEFVANGYISKGQDTMYLQRFNVSTYSTYSHQYMTNVAAAYSQGYTMYNTYKNTGNLDVSLTFKIPLYNNMPEKTELPTTYTLPKKDPDPIEEEVYYSGNLVNDLNLVNTDSYLTGFKVDTLYKDLKDQVSILKGNVSLTIKDSLGKELAINDKVATGNIFEYTDDNGTYTFTVLIKGDLNGDGSITLADLLIMKKAILQSLTLTNLQDKASQINGETELTLKGYLFLKKYLLGVSDIQQ